MGSIWSPLRLWTWTQTVDPGATEGKNTGGYRSATKRIEQLVPSSVLASTHKQGSLTIQCRYLSYKTAADAFRDGCQVWNSHVHPGNNRVS